MWDALFVDQSVPVDLIAKRYMITDLQNWTRYFLLVPIKVIANILLALIMTIKRLLPFQFSHYKLMHQVAAFFLKHFVTPEACYLILRHLCIGSNIVNFLIDNGPNPSLEKSPLYPQVVDDLLDNAFLEHDLIFYNFVLDYAKAQEENPNWLVQVREKDLNYNSIQPVEINIDCGDRPMWKVLDLESAVELFKIIYALFLTSDEFQRAVLSLEFDENFGFYVSKLTEDYRWNHLITNRHPLAPDSPFGAARRLILHGLVTEYLHRYLELNRDTAVSRESPTVSGLS